MNYDLKSESDVKEYLQNLGTEYRFGCYSEKNPEVCHLLADFLETIKKDYEKAAKVYKHNCDDYKFGKSCLKYGSYTLIGKGVKTPDYKAAYGYFEKGCNLEETTCCFNQGLLLVTNNAQFGIAQDISKGMELLDRACAANNGTACYYLSGLHIAGAKQLHKSEEQQKKTERIPRTMEKAFKYAMLGCELGNMYSCVNLSQMFQKGDGVEQNTELAEKYKNKVKEMQKEMESNENLKFGLGLDDGNAGNPKLVTA